MSARRKIVIDKTIEQAIQELQRQFDLGRFYQKLFGFSLAASEAVVNFHRVLDLILVEIIDEQKLAETGSVFSMTEDKTKVRLSRKRGLHSNFIEYTEFVLGQGIAGLVAQTGESVLINGCSSDPRYLRFHGHTQQLRSILAIPLIFKREILGVICIHNSTKTDGFTEMDQFYLTELAKIATVSVHNASIYQSAIWQSLTDPATGLLNRRGIEAALAEHVDTAKKTKQSLSLLFIDIDHLKHFNDDFSMEVGDQVIWDVASSIKKQTSSWHISGKWKEGDEFLVVLPGTNIETAGVVAESIRAEVEKTKLTQFPDELLTISIGVATLEQRFRNHHALVRAAENAKKRAKDEGKNRVILATT